MALIRFRRSGFVAAGLLTAALAAAAPAHGQTAPDQYKPTVGQPGKDAVWVPTSPALLEKMLDMAKVTPSDFVMDLGSGDGRNIIAAAKRGARGVGVEYNADLVAYSNRLAEKEGVADKASFVQGDMYAADISKASVLALFLLPENLDRLVPKFLDLKPGSRIVANTFGITGWTPDETEQIQNECTNWCTSLLWIVPAKVQGTWQTPDGPLTLEQQFQNVTGLLGSTAISGGRLNGDRIQFQVGDVHYAGRVTGGTIEGAVSGGRSGSWSATRQ